MRSRRVVCWSLGVAILLLGESTAHAKDEFAFWIKTDQRVYKSGSKAQVDVFCENKTDSEIVIVGRSVYGVGTVYGSDRLKSWPGIGSVNAVFGPYDDFGNDWIKKYETGTEIHIPPDSRGVFATVWGGLGIGWFTNRIGTGAPLSPGDYVITVRLNRVRTALRTYDNVEISAPVVITPAEWVITGK